MRGGVWGVKTRTCQWQRITETNLNNKCVIYTGHNHAHEGACSQINIIALTHPKKLCYTTVNSGNNGGN